MRYITAIVICIIEGHIYAIIGALLGWKHGGGIIPMAILFAVWGATWRAITEMKQTEPPTQPDELAKIHSLETDEK